VKAGEWLRIDADSLDGSGQLLSLGDMALSSRQSLNNRGTMVANGRFTLTSAGDIVNSGKLLAGSSLDLTSRNLSNGVNGEINAGQNTLNVSDTLFNAGLIDGGYTRINAGTSPTAAAGASTATRLASMPSPSITWRKTARRRPSPGASASTSACRR
jgi:filamentous hemagglutinin